MTPPDFALPVEEGASKVQDLATAVRAFVEPGMTLHVGYSDARPNAALLEIARAFAGRDPGFTLVTAGLVNIQHALVELGLVRKVVASFAGENYPVARPNPALVRAIRDGRVEIEHWSLWSLIARLAAGALGVPYFPVRSMAGSTMGVEAAARGELVETSVGDEPLVLVKALRPDVVVLHGAAADAHGNVVLAAPYGESQWGALAATRGVIACVERIVTTEQLRRMNKLTRIPAHVVRAVCVTPHGAHPYGFNNPGVDGIDSYVEDARFMADTLRASRDPADFKRWIDEWVLGVGDHDGYLAKLGSDRLSALTRRHTSDEWHTPLDGAGAAPAPANATETQVVVAARRLRTAVMHRGHDAVLAGVGLANLASWIGARDLRGRGVDVELMAEIGLFGYSPRPGEPFIFAGQNVPTNKLLTDVMGVLGTFVSGPGTRTIGMIGAGQVDRTGAINSTIADNGDFIVGSGGANDVLSAADEVIVCVGHGTARLVDKVRYVTSPGTNVSTIVTDLCVFERAADGEFVLTTLLPTGGGSPLEAVEVIRERTGWSFPIADDLAIEPPPTAAELADLRAFDPNRLFLRDRSA
ncbi:CoA-transferase [Dactylosporangium sp. NPDC000555]|uniref:CoA-transferase n=1 Tax=Dactylosporangium sp. NPDC000555 TaxID=3154260 RepID=UPI0033343404